MTTFPTEADTLAAEATASSEQKPGKTPHTAPQKPRVAPVKGRTGKKAKGAKKALRAAGGAKRNEQPGSVRGGSKTAKVVELLKRPDGATLKQIMKATGWQPHSVRGFLSGALGKKMGLTVASTKAGDGERVYTLPK